MQAGGVPWREAALEAVRCEVPLAAEGDLLFFSGATFHRTSDSAASRVSLQFTLDEG